MPLAAESELVEAPMVEAEATRNSKIPAVVNFISPDVKRVGC